MIVILISFNFAKTYLTVSVGLIYVNFTQIHGTHLNLSLILLCY